MSKIRLRTKIEVFIAVITLISLVAISVASVTRTISDNADNYETFIRNSNGNLWELSEANIQAAIDDLGEGGWKNGKVWIPGNQEIIINSGIVLSKYVTLDLQGSYLNVQSNVDAITMAEGSTLRGGTIDTRNCETYSKAAIAFSPSDAGHNYWTGHAIVENMYLQGDVNEGSGIEYRCDDQGEIASFTTCRDIHIYKFKYSIFINVEGGGTSGSNTYVNGNTFSNIQLIYPTYGIYLHRNTALSHGKSDCDGNIFDNIVIQTGTDSVRAIYAEGRYNIFDNIFVWDWGVASGPYCYEFPSDSYYQFLKYFGGSDYYLNQGTSNHRINMAKNEQSIMTYNQGSEPDIPDDTMAFWRDSSNNKYYIIQDFGGTQKKAELI